MTCCRRRSSSSMPSAPPHRKCTSRCRWQTPTAISSRAGCRANQGGASGLSCRSAAKSEACSTSLHAMPRSPTRRGSTATSPRITTRSRRCACVLGLRAAPRRIECFDISTIQGSETVASMVVCEDGRMKRSEYRKFRIRGNALARGSGVTRDEQPVQDVHSPAELQRLAADAPDARTPAPGSRFLNDFAAMHEVVLRRYRKLLEAGGPFPDLILIDGGKGQLSSAYAALQELGLANLVAAGIAKKEELLFTRDRRRGDRAAAGQPVAAADSAHPRRGPPVRDHLPPPVPDQARPAVRTRCDRGHRAATAQGAADRVWQPGWCPARHPRRADDDRRREVRGRRPGPFRPPGLSG